MVALAPHRFALQLCFFLGVCVEGGGDGLVGGEKNTTASLEISITSDQVSPVSDG